MWSDGDFRRAWAEESARLEEAIRACMADYERRAVASAEAHALRRARLRELERMVSSSQASDATTGLKTPKTG